MISCSLKTLGECPVHCKDRCAVQPPKARAPLPIPSVKDTIMTAAYIGAVAFFIMLAIAARAEPHFKIEDLKCQEACVRHG